MLSINNKDYDYNEREKKVLELYDQGKSTRDIAKELKMSLRDISIILRKNQASHGIAIIDNGNSDNTNNKSPNQIATQAYKLFSEGKKPYLHKYSNGLLVFNEVKSPSIPIIVYHRIDNSGAPYSTKVSLFTEEMKYLHDNDFKVISLADLVYANATNSFYLKNW